MKSSSSLLRWVRQWLRFNRLFPILTILGAGVPIYLDVIEFIELSIAENIIISLLALLAIDSLSERLTLLEKLESRLSSIINSKTLHSRNEMSTPPELCASASEVCLLAVHGHSVTGPYIGFFRELLDKECTIRIVLLDPDSPNAETYNRWKDQPIAIPFIRSSLESLKMLTQYKSKGSCEVRLINMFLPFSMLAADFAKKNGKMNVEFHSYKLAIDERPHVNLAMKADPFWFNYFRKQFELAWGEASKSES